MTVSVDHDAIRDEGTAWIRLADRMAEIRRDTEVLWLAPTAFFIGNFTEILHYPAYQSFLDRMLDRLRGAETEFELIGLVLRRFADASEETDQLSRTELDRIFTVTDEDVAGVSEEPAPGSTPGSGSDGQHHFV